MILTVVPRRICGTIDLPPSDGEVCRMLAAAAFASAPSVLRCPGSGADSGRMIALLKALGAVISESAGEMAVTPIPRPLPEIKELDFGTSAVCLRILLPAVCLLRSGIRFVARGIMAGQNPAQTLTDLLSEHDCAFDSSVLPFYADGTPDAGTYVFSDLPDEDSLFGLALMLSLCPDRGQIKTDVRFPEPQARVLRIFSLFGAPPEETLYGWFFPAGELIPAAEVLSPRGDSVLACLWLAAGACAGPVTVCGVDPGDSAVAALLPMLEASGATVVVNGSSISAFSEKALEPAEFFDVPAVLLPALTVLCAGATSPVRIYYPTVKDTGFSASVVALNQAFSQAGVSLSVKDGICDIIGDLNPRVSVHSQFPEVIAALVLSACCCRVPLSVSAPEPLLSRWPAFLNNYRLLNGEYTVTSQ